MTSVRITMTVKHTVWDLGIETSFDKGLQYPVTGVARGLAKPPHGQAQAPPPSRSCGREVLGRYCRL